VTPSDRAGRATDWEAYPAMGTGGGEILESVMLMMKEERLASPASHQAMVSIRLPNTSSVAFTTLVDAASVFSLTAEVATA